MSTERQSRQHVETHDPHSRASPVEEVGASAESSALRLDRAAELYAAAPSHSTARPLRQAAIRRVAGISNKSVQRLLGNELQRQADPEQAARQAFLSRGVMPAEEGLDMTSSTHLGGFNVSYNPAESLLLIRLRVGIDYRNAIEIGDAATGAIVPGSPDFAATAVQLNTNFPDPAARIAEVQANWQWSGREDAWGNQYAQMAQDAWGERHFFRSQRWNDVFANARVQMDVHNGHRDSDHCRATVFFVPAGDTTVGAAVTSTGSPTGYTGTFSSSNLAPTSDFLNYRLTYPEGGTHVGQATGATSLGQGDSGPVYLNKFIADFQRGRPDEGAPITITGHASATGSPARNQVIAQERAENVANFLRTQGQQIASYRITTVAAGSDGADADSSWRRVDIQVGDGRAQVTMMHETGHMLGLDDEYSSPAGGFAPGAGSPGTIGQPTAHDALAQQMGGGVRGAVFENNDNIMSVGNVVRPQHYATFLEALNTVTAPERFVYGGAGNAPAPIPDLIGPDVVGGVPDEIPV